MKYTVNYILTAFLGCTSLIYPAIAQDTAADAVLRYYKELQEFYDNNGGSDYEKNNLYNAFREIIPIQDEKYQESDRLVMQFMFDEASMTDSTLQDSATMSDQDNDDVVADIANMYDEGESAHIPQDDSASMENTESTSTDTASNSDSADYSEKDSMGDDNKDNASSDDSETSGDSSSMDDDSNSDTANLEENDFNSPVNRGSKPDDSYDNSPANNIHYNNRPLDKNYGIPANQNARNYESSRIIPNMSENEPQNYHSNSNPQYSTAVPNYGNTEPQYNNMSSNPAYGNRNNIGQNYRRNQPGIDNENYERPNTGRSNSRNTPDNEYDNNNPRYQEPVRRRTNTNPAQRENLEPEYNPIERQPERFSNSQQNAQLPSTVPGQSSGENITPIQNSNIPNNNLGNIPQETDNINPSTIINNATPASNQQMSLPAQNINQQNVGYTQMPTQTYNNAPTTAMQQGTIQQNAAPTLAPKKNVKKRKSKQNYRPQAYQHRYYSNPCYILYPCCMPCYSAPNIINRNSCESDECKVVDYKKQKYIQKVNDLWILS